MDTSREAPSVVVIAGANGAGKSSAAPGLLRGAVHIDVFVNADLIAQGLSVFQPETAAITAGRIMLARLREMADRRETFAYESTLAGRTAHRQLMEFRTLGYAIRLIYLWLPDVELAIERVRLRVEQGGHSVPESVIRRRYGRSLLNFDQIYRPIAATWDLYDGSAVATRPLVGSGREGHAEVVADAGRWAAYRAQVEAIASRTTAA